MHHENGSDVKVVYINTAEPRSVKLRYFKTSPQSQNPCKTTHWTSPKLLSPRHISTPSTPLAFSSCLIFSFVQRWTFLFSVNSGLSYKYRKHKMPLMKWISRFCACMHVFNVISKNEIHALCSTGTSTRTYHGAEDENHITMPGQCWLKHIAMYLSTQFLWAPWKSSDTPY